MWRKDGKCAHWFTQLKNSRVQENEDKSMNLKKLFVKSPSLSPPIPLFEWYPQSKEIFIKSQYEMLKLSIQCTRFESNYSSCTGRSSENICSSIEGAQRKGERGDETQFTTKIWWNNQFGSQIFRFVKFRSQLSISCPIMPKLAVLAL